MEREKDREREREREKEREIERAGKMGRLQDQKGQGNEIFVYGYMYHLWRELAKFSRMFDEKCRLQK